MHKEASPLTGREVDVQDFPRTGAIPPETLLKEVNDGSTIGRWLVSGGAVNNGFSRNSQKYFGRSGFSLDQRQLWKVLALAASKVYLSQRHQKSAFFLTPEEDEEFRGEGRYESGSWRNFAPLTIEQLWSEARELTFEMKALMTLHNLVNAEPSPTAGITLSSASSQTAEGVRTEGDNGSVYTGGIVYGAVQNEALAVLRLLAVRGWISLNPTSNGRLDVSLEPEGLIVNDRIALGLSALRKCFLVCRFKDEVHRIYHEVYKPLGDDLELRCPINRVMDLDYVGSISDKIVQEINEASIVMVDLSYHNFNVAFEAGYALALGKPIVWTKSQRGRTVKFPFDIQSENIMLYDPMKLDDFRRKLKPRIIAALSEVNQAGLPLYQVRAILSDVQTQRRSL